MMMKLMLLTQCVLIGTILAACGSHDYETVFGGYEYVNGAEDIVFDIDPATNDIVVGGKINTGHLTQGLLYYIDDSICKIKWVIDMHSFELGVRDVRFNSNFDKVVGVAEAHGTTNFFTVNLSNLDYKTFSLKHHSSTLAPVILVDDSASSVIWHSEFELVYINLEAAHPTARTLEQEKGISNLGAVYQKTSRDIYVA